MVDRFGDYRCTDGWDISIMKTIIFLGGVIGLLVGSLLKRCCTDRQLIIIVLGLSVFGGAVTLVSWSPAVAVFGMTTCLCGAFVKMEVSTAFTI